MNRAIKFRIWDIKTKQYVTSSLITKDNEVYYPEIHPAGGVYFSRMEGHELIYLNDNENCEGRFALQQFTGLKADDGTEIYEGDIIQYYIPWNGETVVRLVKYDETFLSFFVGSVDESFVDLCDVIDMEKIKVIGNILESPELLKND